MTAAWASGAFDAGAPRPARPGGSPVWAVSATRRSRSGPGLLEGSVVRNGEAARRRWCHLGAPGVRSSNVGATSHGLAPRLDRRHFATNHLATSGTSTHHVTELHVPHSAAHRARAATRRRRMPGRGRSASSPERDSCTSRSLRSRGRLAGSDRRAGMSRHQPRRHRDLGTAGSPATARKYLGQILRHDPDTRASDNMARPPGIS
jgi:hypothetical protein